LIFKQKLSKLTVKSRRYACRYFLVLNSQENLRRSDGPPLQQVSESIGEQTNTESAQPPFGLSPIIARYRQAIDRTADGSASVTNAPSRRSQHGCGHPIAAEKWMSESAAAEQILFERATAMRDIAPSQALALEPVNLQAQQEVAPLSKFNQDGFHRSLWTL